MERKKFILQGIGAVTLLALGKSTIATNGSGKKPFMIKSGKGRFNESFLYKGKNPNDIKISGKDTDGQIAMFEYIGHEKTGPSYHVHFNQDEVFYVVAGNYRFLVGEETVIMGPGDTIFLPRNIPHTWIQQSEEGKLIYFVQPAGKAEEFFRTMNNLKESPTKAQIEKIHEDYGMKIVGPPLTI